MTAMASSGRFVAASLRMSCGLLAWAMHLGIVYVVVATRCARPAASSALLSTPAIRLALAVVTVLALATAGGMLARTLSALRSDERSTMSATAFVDWMTAAVAAFGVVGILWNAIPPLLLPLCG